MLTKNTVILSTITAVMSLLSFELLVSNERLVVIGGNKLETMLYHAGVFSESNDTQYIRANNNSDYQDLLNQSPQQTTKFVIDLSAVNDNHPLHTISHSQINNNANMALAYSCEPNNDKPFQLKFYDNVKVGNNLVIVNPHATRQVITQLKNDINEATC